MATEAQIAANRLNAQKSTGPRTAEGKAVVAQNAVKHGLCARQAVIVGEDPGEFEFHRDQMLEELAPVGATESMLAERAVRLAWRLQRAERIQDEAFGALHAKQVANPLAKLTRSLRPQSAADDDEDLLLGRMIVADFANTRVLDRLLMYERRIENSLYKTMTELQKLRLLREMDDSSRQTNPIEANGSVRRELTRADEDRTPHGVTTNSETKPIEAGDARNEPISAEEAKRRAAAEEKRAWEQGVWNRTCALHPRPLVLERQPPRPAKRSKTAVRIRRT